MADDGHVGLELPPPPPPPPLGISRTNFREDLEDIYFLNVQANPYQP